MTRFLALAWLLTCGVALATEPVDPPSTSTIGYATVAEALSDLRANPANSVRVQDGWTIVNDRVNHIIWSFTPEGHAAHPAAIKRVISERDGAVYLELDALCQAPKEPCDALIKEFQLLTEKIRADIKAGRHR